MPPDSHRNVHRRKIKRDLKRDRLRPPVPGYADWETLCALIPVGQVLDIYECDGRVSRAVLLAHENCPDARPVTRASAVSLVSHGWLARLSDRRVGSYRVTSYRLSLRGWYAVKRLRPSLAALAPRRSERASDPERIQDGQTGAAQVSPAAPPE